MLVLDKQTICESTHIYITHFELCGKLVQNIQIGWVAAGGGGQPLHVTKKKKEKLNAVK